MSAEGTLPGEDIARKLRDLLGLNKYESLAYLAVLKLGSARPQDVAKEAGIPPQRIYDVLKSLQSMGLLDESEGIYSAVDPRQAASVIAESEVVKTLSRASAIRELGNELSRLYRAAAARPQLRLVKGLETVLGAAMSYSNGCESRPIFMAFKVFDRLSQVAGHLKDLVRSLPHGAVVIVPRGFIDKYRDSVAEFSQYNLKFVESDAAFIDLMVSCNAVIIGVPWQGDAVAVVINDEEFATALYSRLASLAGLS